MARLRNWSVRRQLWTLTVIGLSAAAIFPAAVGVVAIRIEEQEVAEVSQVTSPALFANAAILQTMTSADDSLNAYGATGDPALLDPYHQAARAIGAEQRQLAALLARGRFGSAERARYQRLQAAQTAAIARWWRYTDKVRAMGTHAGAAEVIASGDILDRVRAANAALDSSLHARRSAQRAQAARTLSTSLVVLIVVTAFMLLAGLAVAAWVARILTDPVLRLREVVRRQRQGNTGAIADEERGPAEIRSLSAAFNAMTARTARLSAEQAEALRLQRAVFDAGRAIRDAADTRAAMEIICACCGEAVHARRVMVAVIGDAPKAVAGAEWHAPDLEDLRAVPEDMAPRFYRVAIELWERGDRLVISDLSTGETADDEWGRMFRRDTGATALIMVPIGLGSRVIGALSVVTDTGPRQWTQAEVLTVQQLATYLARTVIQVERDEERAEYTSRLESLDRQKTEFLGTVSHELRTPLTSIQGYLELLIDEDAGPLADDQRRMLGIIERNTARLRGLIEDILVLNRIETGGLVPGSDEITLTDLAASTAEDLRPQADSAGVRLDTRVDINPVTITGDRGQVLRALVNVLSNAIKFTPEGGEVRLSCTADQAAGEAVVTCQDTGIGIPEADLEHLFTRFFRAGNATSRAIPGTGLGLAIVHAIVEAHHGRLTLDSTEGQGTTVTLRFPLANQPDGGDQRS